MLTSIFMLLINNYIFSSAALLGHSHYLWRFMLHGKRIAILATDGYEQSELTEPLKRLRNADAEVRIVSLEKGDIRG